MSDEQKPPQKEEEMELVRQAMNEIQQYRAEWADRIRRDFEEELAKLEAEGYDPTRGRGRGPAWADGG